MAELEKVEAPSWAQQQSQLEDVEAPSWAERGVLERAGSAMAETAGEGWEAAKKLVTPPADKRDYLGPSGMLRSLKETGAGIISPLTMTAGPVLSGVESVAASGLGAAQRALEKGISKGVGLFSPEKEKELEAKIPTSEQAYETARPYASAALSAVGSRPGATVSVPPTPPKSPFGITLTEGEQTGALPVIKREQAALRAQAGEPAYEHAQTFREQRAAQVDAAKTQLARDLDQLGGQALVQTPQEAGELASQGIRGARKIVKEQVNKAYEEARARPGEINAGIFEGMPQRIKGDLTLAEEPVVVDNATTPAAASMIRYLDKQVGNLKIQNLADPFGAPSQERITGVSLNGVDRWRRILSGLKRGAATPEDRRAANSIMDAFDNRIDRAINEGHFNGDPDAIFAWNAARGAHLDYRNLFTKRGARDSVGDVIEKITGRGWQDPATPNDVIRFITGASGTTPNSLNVGVARRIKDILGDSSPEWAGIKQGVLHKLVSTAEDVKDFSPGRIATNLGEFLHGKGSTLAKEIYSPSEMDVLRSFGKTMRKMEVPQAGANWSNNTPMVQAAHRIVKAIATGIGATLGHFVHPGLGEFVGASAGYMAGEMSEKVLYARNLKRLAKQMPLMADQIAQWQRAVARAQDVPAMGKVEIGLASRRLAHAIYDLFHGNMAIPVMSEKKEDKGMGFNIENPKGFAKGGRVTKTFRYPS